MSKFQGKMENSTNSIPRQPRQGWEEQLNEMHKNGDDKLLFDDVFEDEHFED